MTETNKVDVKEMIEDIYRSWIENEITVIECFNSISNIKTEYRKEVEEMIDKDGRNIFINIYEHILVSLQQFTEVIRTTMLIDIIFSIEEKGIDKLHKPNVVDINKFKKDI